MTFPTASQLHWTSDSFADSLKTPSLRPIVRAYVANLRRSLATHELLDCVVHSTALHERARYRVRMEFLKRPFSEQGDGQLTTDSVRAAAKAEWLTFRPQAFPGESKAPDSPLEFGDKEDIPEAMPAYAGGQFCLEASLENQITNTWTAVESLYRRLGHEADAARIRAAGAAPPIRMRFASLWAARETFEKIFDPDPMPGALGDTSLDLLAAVRNALEHNAGYCDQDYLQKAAVHSALPQLPVGDKLHLTGPMTLGFIQPLIWVVQRLIQEVDEWIRARP